MGVEKKNMFNEICIMTTSADLFYCGIQTNINCSLLLLFNILCLFEILLIKENNLQIA